MSITKENENDIDLADDEEEDEEEEEEIKSVMNNEDSSSDEDEDDEDMEDEDARFIATEETMEDFIEQIEDPMIEELLNEDQTDNQKEIEETEVEIETNQPQPETKKLSLAAQVDLFLKGKQNIVVEKEESIAKSIYCTALSYHSKRDYDRAIDYYFKVLKREFVEQALVDPSQKEFFEIKSNIFVYLKYLALKNLGALFITKKNYLDASIALAKALTIDDKDPSVWYDYGVACFKNNDHAAAKLALEKTLLLSPNHHPAFNLLLELCYIVGDIEGCDSVSKDILKLSSDHKIAKFIQKECNPNPYNLTVFQNSALSNPFYKRWVNYCVPVDEENEKEDNQKCSVKITELDWKFICTKLLKVYTYMKCDCEIKIVYEEVVTNPPENNSLDNEIVSTNDESKTQESLRRFKRKRYDLSLPSNSKKPKTLYGQLALDIVSFTHLEPSSLNITSESSSDNNIEITSQDIPIEPLKKWIHEVNGRRLNLFDAINHLLELICGSLWNYKWPEGLSSILSNMTFTLSRHNVSHSFTTTLCIAEILYDRYEETNELGYLEMTRRLFNKLGSSLIISETALGNVDRTTKCRALWLRGLMERTSKSITINKWFEQLNLVIREDIILPNYTKNNIISKRNIESKILELNFNIILDNIRKQRENGNFVSALKSVSEPLTTSLPEKSYPLLSRILCSILGRDHVKVTDLETLEKSQIIAILDFLFSYFTKHTSDMLEDPDIDGTIKIIDNYVQNYIFSDEDIRNSKPVHTLALKTLSLLDALGLGKRNIKSHSKKICRFLKIFYYLAPFKSDQDRVKFLSTVRKKVLYEFEPLRRIKLQRLLEKLPSDKSFIVDRNTILFEISTAIFITFEMKINLTDSGPDTKYKDCKKTPKKFDLDANSILFKILKPTFQNKLEGISSTRQQILPFINMIANSFDDIPQECRDIKFSIEPLLDGDLLFEEAVSLPTITTESDEYKKYKDVYQEIHYYASKYLHKEISSTFIESAFKDEEYLFSTTVYKIEKSLCCKPDNYNCWITLGQLYYTVLELLLDIIDVTNRSEFLFKQSLDRQHLRLSHDADFEKDLDIFTRRCLNSFVVALKLCTTPEEQGKIHAKIGSLLFSIHDCRKYFKQYFAPFSESQISNECFDHLQKAYQHDQKNNLLLFLMARIRHKMDSPSVEYMHLYLKSLKIKNNDETWFYFNTARLGILEKKEPTNDRIFNESYSSEIVTLSNSYYSTCPIINNIPVVNFSADFTLWRLVLESYYNMLKSNVQFFKCLSPVSQCFSSENGPWNDLTLAGNVLSSVVKKRINKSSPPTIEIEAPTCPSKEKKRFYRESKLLILKAYLDVVTRKKDMECFMNLIHWMIHDLLEKDRHLSICLPDILSSAISILFKLIEEKPTENHLKYAIPLYFAISKVRKNKNSLNNNQNLIDQKLIIREYLSKNPSTSQCVVTEKGTKKNLNTFYQKEYFVDLIKFKNIEKEETKEKKKDKKHKKEKNEKKEKKEKNEKNEKKEKKEKKDKPEKKVKSENKDKKNDKNKKENHEKKAKVKTEKKENKITEPLLKPSETKRRKKQPHNTPSKSSSSSSEVSSPCVLPIDLQPPLSQPFIHPSLLPSSNASLNLTPEKKSPSKKVSSSPSKQATTTNKSPKKEFIFHNYTPQTSTPYSVKPPQSQQAKTSLQELSASITLEPTENQLGILRSTEENIEIISITSEDSN